MDNKLNAEPQAFGDEICDSSKLYELMISMLDKNPTTRTRSASMKEFIEENDLIIEQAPKVIIDWVTSRPAPTEPAETTIAKLCHRQSRLPDFEFDAPVNLRTHKSFIKTWANRYAALAQDIDQMQTISDELEMKTEKREKVFLQDMETEKTAHLEETEKLRMELLNQSKIIAEQQKKIKNLLLQLDN